MIGKTYLLRGEPVTILARWAPPAEVGSATCPACGTIREMSRGARGFWHYCVARPDFAPARRQGPRNVLIQFADGTLQTRPFRGLRRQEATS